ncbi:uncharacterized protein L201_005344 [Kwoniella dendrophila CBS 6074]|uniref:VASt domain-containing protein n=1 Tax=Kwoniella dendrophila CBS 6074 TaxID=1295534 RepID=A0AAX4JZU0_9TREE
MAPSGLVISKLGIQATASDDVVRGLMCLKISLPKESAGRPGARWALFGSTPPKILSTPTLYPLPLPIPASRTKQLRIASKLLSLNQSTSYPPSPPTNLGGKPYIDISSTTGKVYVVVDPISSSRSRRNSQGHRVSGSGSTSSIAPSSGNRKEWLICMEFEIPLEIGLEEGISKVLLPIPKCLDNTIRFQILSPANPSSSSSTSSLSSLNQEINILTDPKMLPLPPNAFASPTKKDRSFSSRQRAKGHGKGKGKIKATVGEEGWEDGEVLGPDDVPTESDEDTEVSEEEDKDEDEDDQEGGSWLEGRFQSTETLRLEWSFNSPASSDIPSLQISPIWNKQQSTISISYTAQIVNTDNPVQLHIDVPDGWAWSDFVIQGESLSNWRCNDGDWGFSHQDRDPDATLENGEYDDSFATVRAKRNSRPITNGLTPTSSVESTTSNSLPNLRTASSSSASLMRQTFPSLNDKMEDFSFELSAIDQKPTPPRSLKKSPLQMLVNSTSTSLNGKWEEPKFGRSFSLYLLEDSEDRLISTQGTLVLIDKTMFVSQFLPSQIPFIRIEDQAINQCQVECPLAIYGNAKEASSNNQLVDISLGGRFCWISESEKMELMKKEGIIKGNVKVKLRRSNWGVITSCIVFPFPSKSEEVGFSIPHNHLDHGENIRISRTTMDGIEIPKAIYHENGITQIRINRGFAISTTFKSTSSVEVEWEMILGQKGEIALPIFDKGSEGEMKVDLIGDNWMNDDLRRIQTNMKSISPTKYTYPLAPSSTSPNVSPPKLSIPPWTNNTNMIFSKKKGLLSFSSLFNLILIWLLLSMGQQLQRIKNELNFVKDEYKDLRLYGLPNDQHNLQNLVKDDNLPILTTTIATTTTTVTQIQTETIIPTTKEDYSQNNHPDKPETKTDGYRDLIVKHQERPYPLGRVVWGNKGWNKWLSHPTVRNLTNGLGWVWNFIFGW